MSEAEFSPEARASSLVAKAARLHRAYRGFESLLAQPENRSIMVLLLSQSGPVV